MMLDIGKVKKIGLFASGVLFGTAGSIVLNAVLIFVSSR